MNKLIISMAMFSLTFFTACMGPLTDRMDQTNANMDVTNEGIANTNKNTQELKKLTERMLHQMNEVHKDAKLATAFDLLNAAGANKNQKERAIIVFLKTIEDRSAVAYHLASPIPKVFKSNIVIPALEPLRDVSLTVPTGPFAGNRNVTMVNGENVGGITPRSLTPETFRQFKNAVETSIDLIYAKAIDEGFDNYLKEFESEAKEKEFYETKATELIDVASTLYGATSFVVVNVSDADYEHEKQFMDPTSLNYRYTEGLGTRIRVYAKLKRLLKTLDLFKGDTLHRFKQVGLHRLGFQNAFENDFDYNEFIDVDHLNLLQQIKAGDDKAKEKAAKIVEMVDRADLNEALATTNVKKLIIEKTREEAGLN